MKIRFGYEMVFNCPQATPMVLLLNAAPQGAQQLIVPDFIYTDPYRERKGVCRDLAHLAIAFCRGLNIPARYATGYLGDIGVPAVDTPMDFAGCMEAYLEGAWHTFDPRNNARRIGRLMIARGRDAADVAISTSFGPCFLQLFRVWTDEISDALARQLQSTFTGSNPAFLAA